MRLIRMWAAAIVLLGTLPALAQQATKTADEATVWQLEHSYWEYVKAEDLKSYLKLWHPNFLGWPYISPAPRRKDHITDWMTAHTSKGLHLSSYLLQPAESQATENLVVTYYWVTLIWADKKGPQKPQTLRVAHTWIKVDKGWQIVGGMSAAETKK